MTTCRVFVGPGLSEVWLVCTRVMHVIYCTVASLPNWATVTHSVIWTYCHSSYKAFLPTQKPVSFPTCTFVTPGVCILFGYCPLFDNINSLYTLITPNLMIINTNYICYTTHLFTVCSMVSVIFTNMLNVLLLYFMFSPCPLGNDQFKGQYLRYFFVSLILGPCW